VREAVIQRLKEIAARHDAVAAEALPAGAVAGGLAGGLAGDAGIAEAGS
jgi:hypothetical protein